MLTTSGFQPRDCCHSRIPELDLGTAGVRFSSLSHLPERITVTEGSARDPQAGSLARSARRGSRMSCSLAYARRSFLTSYCLMQSHQRNGGPWSLRTLPKITQLTSGRAETRSVVFSTHHVVQSLLTGTIRMPSLHMVEPPFPSAGYLLLMIRQHSGP